MDIEATAPSGSETVSSNPISLDEGFAALIAGRDKKPEAESAEPAQAATAEPESAVEADAAPQGTTAEDQGTEPETPAIEPPKSWSKDAHERWSKLDRDTQEFLASRDSEDQKAIKRSLQEAAEARKSFETRVAEVSAEREKYLTGLVSQDQSLEAELTQKFPNIKTMDDVNFLANEALRLSQSGGPDDLTQSQQIQAYLTAWNTLQQKIAHVKSERASTERQQETERNTKWTSHVQEENAKFQGALTEADKGKLKELLEAAPAFLKERGFTDQELSNFASGKDRLSIYDSRMQALILDGMKYRDLQKAPPQALKPTVPPVQRPGVAQPRGAAQAATLQAQSQKLSQSGDIEDALALLTAKRAVRR